LWGGEIMYPPRVGARRWRGVRRQNVAREAHGGFKSLLASRLRPLSSKATHPSNYLSLFRLWAQLSLVVTVVFPAVAGETTSLGSRCVPASGGRVLLPTSLVRCSAAPRSSTWQITAALAARGLRSWTTITRCGQRTSVRSSRRSGSERRSSRTDRHLRPTTRSPTRWSTRGTP